jgi:hypothetical protein
LLTTPESSLHPFEASVGSLLRVLDLDCPSSTFLDDYSANAASIRLEKLSITFLDTGNGGALLRCIPSLIFPKELEIGLVLRGAGQFANRLDAALKRNGSIVRLSVPSRSEYEGLPEVSSDVVKRVDTFCKRNQNIPFLLCSGMATKAENDTMHDNDTMQGAPLDASNVALFPSLFFVAFPARRHAPNNVFNGLLSASDDVGPYYRSSKRSHSY